ncbi:MAG: PEGA domain-containing protein [Myxococcota bacterium]|nr:PEGA domain-containing protein [Myxococcota bacterium]
MKGLSDGGVSWFPNLAKKYYTFLLMSGFSVSSLFGLTGLVVVLFPGGVVAQAQNQRSDQVRSEPQVLASTDEKTGQRDLPLEARALEMAGVKGLGILLVTSDPVGSDVYIDGNKTCFTPCRRTIPPGKYRLVFKHPKRETSVVETEVTTSEQIQVHVILGEKAPWKLILPTYFVGAIFTLGGLSSIIVHENPNLGSSDVPADEHRFHRNLGIASLAIGIPLLAFATYLSFVGRPGQVRTSIAPGDTDIHLIPLTDQAGTLSGAGLNVTWR